MSPCLVEIRRDLVVVFRVEAVPRTNLKESSGYCLKPGSISERSCAMLVYTSGCHFAGMCTCSSLN